MKKIIYLSLLLPAFMLQGCDDFLGNKPKGYTIPETFEDYSKLLNPASMSRTLSTDAYYLTDDIHLLDDTCKYSDIAYVNQDNHERNLYAFKGGAIHTPGDEDRLWSATYDRIYTYNTVINNIMGSTGSSEDEKLRVKAEALFHRAYEYLNLVNIYATHYNAATAATDYGIPLIQEAAVVQKYKRSTVAEVYKKIEEDLNEAFPNLKTTPLNLFHPSQAAAYSFYARMYLYMGNYSKALENVNKALEANTQLQDLKPFMVKGESTFDRIQLEDGSWLLDKHENPEAIYVRLPSSRKNIAVSKDLLNAFKRDLSDGSVDQRRNLFYADDTVNMGRIDYFYGETCYVLYSDFNVGFSSVENYLIAAECEARIGSKDRAMELLDQLRNNRIINNKNLSASSQDDALTKVLDERRREFALMGIHRLIDLKRLNMDDRFKKTVTHTADGETYTLAPGDNRYIFPINSLILLYNPDMPQYDR